MGFYPKQINSQARDPQNAGRLDDANARGTAASFLCGSFVRFSLRVDDARQRIESAKFQTNGCGFMIASAEAMSDLFRGRELRGLHGTDSAEIMESIRAVLGTFPEERIQCAEVAIEALKNAFADYRRYRIEEFQGEKALICTCFGVSEESIAKVIAESGASEVSTVSAICRAGSGCGSCRMLIQEMIDEARDAEIAEF
jgi:NifU-like protein